MEGKEEGEDIPCTINIPFSTTIGHVSTTSFDPDEEEEERRRAPTPSWRTDPDLRAFNLPRAGPGDNLHISSSMSAPHPTLVTRLKKKLQREPKLLRLSSGSTSCCIHMVPQCLRRVHKDEDYSPQIISIGPFHRWNYSLKAMEEHKLKYVEAFVSRNENVSLEKCLVAVKELENRARECYSETVSLDSNAFVEKMVVDGCFIIELLCKAKNIFSRTENDPIFNLRWLMRQLQNDLLLLENQIPYLVLQRLFDLMNIPGDVSLARLAVDFFKNLVPINNKIMEKHPNVEYLHLLHLLHSNIIPETNMEGLKKEDKSNRPKMIHCITELCEAGIEFKKGEEDSFLDIKYNKGVITIPPLRIEDFTNSLLLNLIAFEQCYRYCGIHVTAYAIFMDCLINSAKDIEVLHHNDIIDNWLGNDEVMADFFNRLGREVMITSREFYLADVFNEVLKYYDDKCHVWRANLMHKYFYNPWAIISLLAAIVLLCLTFIQTLFAGMGL